MTPKADRYSDWYILSCGVLLVVISLAWLWRASAPLTGQIVDKSSQCSQTTPRMAGKVAYWQELPAQYLITVRATNGREKSCYVTEQEYGQLKVGETHTCGR